MRGQLQKKQPLQLLVVLRKWDRHDLCSEVPEIKRVIARGDRGPVLLIPYNLDYPGLDGVLCGNKLVCGRRSSSRRPCHPVTMGRQVVER